MIAAIFNKISKRQRLTDKTIEKLLRCLNDSVSLSRYYKSDLLKVAEALAENIFSVKFSGRDQIYKSNIVTRILSSDFSGAPDEMKKISAEIKKAESEPGSKQEKVWSLFLAEIELIRKDAISAFYNCALRDTRILTRENLKKVASCLKDKNKEIRAFAVKIFAVLKDSQDINYAMVFASCLDQLIDNVELEQSLDYIDQQSKDPKRCQELFTDDVILQLTNLLRSSSYTEKFKVDCMEVILNYLEQSFARGLTSQVLTNFCLILRDKTFDEKGKRNNLKERVLISMLLTTEKEKSLPKEIIKFLVKEMKNLDDYSANFIIILLGTICEKINIPDIEEILPKLQDNRVVIGEGSTITFEPPSSENASEVAISTITAKIILSSLKKGASKVSLKVLDNLIEALNSSDKQTRILAAKAISVASDLNAAEFRQSHLEKLKNFLTDDIPDIAIYSTNAYTRVLQEFSRGNIQIYSSQIEVLVTAYAYEELKLGEEDFSAVINKNILETFANQASNKIFYKNIFEIIDSIFMSDDDSFITKQALEIMRVYAENQFKLPEMTITAIENVLGKDNFESEALDLLEKIIRNGQAVNDKTLKKLVENLYFFNEDDEELKMRSFKVLEKADENQDLPDDIFEILELERAGAVIKSNDFEDALKFLEMESQLGRKLPYNVLKALNKQIQDPQILSILVNVTTNGQLLPSFMISELSKRFNPEKKKQKKLIKIFLNLAKNNQDLPKELLNRLEKRLGQKANVDEIPLIFAYWVQKGKELPENLLDKISEKFFTAPNQSIKHECLSAFVSIIQTQKDFPQELVEKVLTKGLNDENEHVLETSLKGFDFICGGKTRLSQESIEVLIEKVGDQTCSSDDLKHRIKRFLDSQSLNNHQANLLKLATLDCEPKSQFLNSLIEILQRGGSLLERNFQQINSIINESPSSQEEAIDMLVSYSNLSVIPEYLIDSTATIMLNTSKKKIRDQCLVLIEKVVESGKRLPEKTVSRIMALQDVDQLLLKKIEENQEIHGVANLISDFKKETWLGSFKRARVTINKLVSLAKESKDDANIRDLALIFSQAILQDSQYVENETMVEIIEKVIEAKGVELNIVQAYKKLIRSQKCKRLLESLDILVSLLPENQYAEESEIRSEIILCIANAAILGDFCEKGIQLMEKNLASPDTKIRMKCFQGLRARNIKGEKSEIFKAYCAGLLDKLRAEVGIRAIPLWDLLEALAYAQDLNLRRLMQVPQDNWIRELLLLRIIANVNANSSQTALLEKEWLKTEKYFREKKLDSNQILKALAESQPFTFECLEQAIKFLPKIEFNKIEKFFLESLDPFQELKQQWLISLLTKCLNQANQDYIDWLASNLNLKLAPDVIEKLLGAISKVDNLNEFESLLDFAEQNKIQSNDIEIKGALVCEIRRSLEIKLLVSRLKYPINRYKFSTMGNSLLDRHWSFDKLLKMLQKIESFSASERREKEQSLLQILKIIYHYKIPVNKFEKIFEILDAKLEEWIQKANEIAIESCFPMTQEKRGPMELIAQLQDMNPSNGSLLQGDLAKTIEQINDPKLMSRLDFKNYLSNEDQLMKLGNPISGWTKTEISLWAKVMKSNPRISVVESLAVIKRANFLSTKFYLTDAQILSCIVQLNANPKQGRLLQVGTGEGKSTIVAVIAIIHALQGSKVDIITSSPVLAERDAKEKADFYKMFGLNCMDNCDKSLYVKGPKICYKQDIVYGEIAQFQFDTLRDKYSLLGTLAGRGCEVAIIDEVDSMLIDDSSNIARLSSTIAGMDLLQPFIHLVWNELNHLQQRFIVVDEKNYLLSEQAVQIPKNLEDLKKDATEIEEDVETYLIKELRMYVDKKLIENGAITIPANFKEFVENQISKWINNAIIALMNQEDHQYIIQEGVIKPVAFDSTGVVQTDTHWADGLHQFIQRKHLLKMTCETLTTNFLSNIGYIKRYKSKLFGLTGTLGSEKAQEVFSKVYNVDLVLLPNLYEKKYLELPAIICKDSKEWLEEICESALVEASKERGVLIICQTIEDCKVVAQKLREKYRAGAVKLYTMNNMNQERDIDKINPGEIIVATNLAGRGTDIKTDNIEKNGGLHVIVTFLPCNKRVEDQAFGRTARQGKRGTGQMILNRSALLQYGNASSEKIKEMRDGFESVMLDEFLKEELLMVNKKDDLFAKFCELKHKLREEVKLKNLSETNMLNALEERWALFLHKIDNGIIPLSQSEDKYKVFEKQIWQDFYQNELIKNPYYHISIAHELLMSSSFFNSKYDQALKHFDQAIKLDSQNTAAAFVGKAWLAIENEDQKKSQILNDLIEALKLLSDEMALFDSLQLVLKKEDSNLESDLSKQLIQKISIPGSYRNSIVQAVSVIKKSQRLFDITGTKYYQRDVKSKTKGDDNDIQREDYNADIVKKTSKVYDIERENMKEAIQTMKAYDKFTVTFHDLTVFSDSGDKDQAIETISNVFEKHYDTCEGKINQLLHRTKNLFKTSSVLDPSSYKDLALTIEGLHTEELKIMFAPDIKIMDADQQTALAELNRENLKSRKVHLEYVVDGKVQSRKTLEISQAIKSLEKEKDQELRFNIYSDLKTMFMKKEISSDFALTLESFNLDCETVKNNLQQVQPKSLHLEILGSKTEILKSLQNSAVKHVQLLTPQTDDIVEAVYPALAIAKINKMKKDDQVRIRIENLEHKLAYQILDSCPTAVFHTTFIGVNPSFISKGYEGGTTNLSFTKMSPPLAQELIRILRKSSLDFTLQFDNLNSRQLKGVIAQASLKQENLKIVKVKALSESWMENARPNLELSEFAARGIEHVFELTHCAPENNFLKDASQVLFFNEFLFSFLQDRGECKL